MRGINVTDSGVSVFVHSLFCIHDSIKSHILILESVKEEDVLWERYF